jgi:hypothetical protein
VVGFCEDVNEYSGSKKLGYLLNNSAIISVSSTTLFCELLC